MADAKWIKITVDMFDNRKIRHLRKLPDGNNIVLIWVMLLTIAGRCNDGGKVYLTEDIPYSTKMLADELDFKEKTVDAALKALSRLNMVQMDSDGFFEITGWGEHQNIDGMDRIRNQTRNRVAEYRKKQKTKQQENCNVTCNVTATQGNAIEEDRDIDKELDKDIDDDIDKDIKSQSSSSDTCMTVTNLFNDICVSYKPVGSLDIKRIDAIESLLHTYSLEKVKEAFIKAEASEFLKGSQGDWKMTFDWIIVSENMAKVLSGNYDKWNGNRKKPSNKFGQFHQRENNHSELEKQLIRQRCASSAGGDENNE